MQVGLVKFELDKKYGSQSEGNLLQRVNFCWKTLLL